MADNLTQQEIIDTIKQEIAKIKSSGIPSIALRGDATSAQIAADANKITSKKELQTYLKSGVLPTHGFTETALAQVAGVPYGAAANQPLGGAAVGPGKLFQSAAKLGSAVFAKKAAEEGVKTAAKMSLKKKAAIGAVGLYAGSKAAGSIASAVGGNKDTATSANQSQAEIDMANAVAAADAAGLDVNQIINTPAGQQLNLSSNNLPAFMAKFGLGTTGLTGVGSVGIYTGKDITDAKYAGAQLYSTTKPELVSLAEWSKKFPSDAAGLASAKQKFVNAGVLSPTDGIDKIKSAWDAYGKMSLEYSRAGNKLSPWQILDMQKGLSGSGSQTSTTIDTSPMAESDVRTLTKRQLSQSLGLANIDDKMFKDILAIVRKNEAKNPTKTVRTTTGNTTKVKSTPGYGQSDVLADVEAYAKKDPRYAEFQTANVFGQGLTQALGLKA
jgi:hypothetical protein